MPLRVSQGCSDQHVASPKSFLILLLGQGCGHPGSHSRRAPRSPIPSTPAPCPVYLPDGSQELPLLTPPLLSPSPSRRLTQTNATVSCLVSQPPRSHSGAQVVVTNYRSGQVPGLLNICPQLSTAASRERRLLSSASEALCDLTGTCLSHPCSCHCVLLQPSELLGARSLRHALPHLTRFAPAVPLS